MRHFFTVAALASMALGSATAAYTLPADRMMHGSACLAAGGSPDSGVSTRTNPDPVTMCRFYPAETLANARRAAAAEGKKPHEPTCEEKYGRGKTCVTSAR